jgi:hypothetical protein
MAKNKQAAIIDVKEMLKPQKRALSKSWVKAAGILKHKKVNPLKYQRQIRAEWEKRFKKLLKISSYGSRY